MPLAAKHWRTPIYAPSWKGILVPTLIIAGHDDAVTTVDDAKALVAGIPGAQCVILPASHLSSVEAWRAFNRTFRAFWMNSSRSGNVISKA